MLPSEEQEEESWGREGEEGDVNEGERESALEYDRPDETFQGGDGIEDSDEEEGGEEYDIGEETDERDEVLRDTQRPKVTVIRYGDMVWMRMTKQCFIR